MADFFLKSGAGAVERANATAYVLGNKVVIARADTTANYLVVRKWVMECTTAGTTGAAVPAWPATVAAADTLADGTVTWTFRKPGFSSGTTVDWAFSAIYVDYLVTAIAAGDTIYQSNNDSESIAAAITLAFPGTLAAPNYFLCVNDTVTSGFTAATTGQIATTATSSIIVTGNVHWSGTIFKCASGAVNASLTLGAANAIQSYTSCDFYIVASGAACRLAFGTNGNSNYGVVNLKNCRASFAAAGQGVLETICHLIWDGGSIITGSTAQTTFILDNGLAGRLQSALISGFDFTNLGAATNLCGFANSPQDILFRNCKLPASWTGVLAGGTAALASKARMHNVDNADTNYRIWEEGYTGSVKSETVIVKTSGASDGTTALSWKMTSSANAKYPLLPLESGEIAFWNETTAAAKTLTVEIIHDSLTNLKDDEVWLDVQYLGTAGFPLSSFISDSKTDVLATAADQTASTAAWTTTGLTNPNKQKLSVTLTPQEKGYYLVKVKLAKASYTIYADPLVVVT